MQDCWEIIRPFIAEYDKKFAHLDLVESYESLDEDARREYDADVKAYRTIVGQLKYAALKGYAEGYAEGRAEACSDMIEKMYSFGESVMDISRIFNVDESVILRILGI